MLQRIKNHLKSRILISILKKGNPEKMRNFSEKKAVEMFRFAYKHIPAYKKIISEKNIFPESISNLKDFQKLPLIDKEIFQRFNLSELCVSGSLKGIASAFTSSGFTGNFSYGLATEDDEKKVKESIPLLFKEFINAGKDTMIINASAMGTSFKSPYPLVNTSVRPDMVLSILKKFKIAFEKFVIIGDPHFIKKIAEEGEEELKSVKASIIFGGDWVSNSLCEHVMKKAGINFNDRERGAFITMGMSEFGLNIFHSSPALSKARSIIQKDEKLKKEIFNSIRTAPEILYYSPFSEYIEIIDKDENGFGEIVITSLNKKAKMPLIRYRTGDIGKIISCRKFAEIMQEYGISPEFRLPLICVLGRKSSFIKIGDKKITPEDIKEAVYRSPEISSKITGYFRIEQKKPISFQLKKGIKINSKIKKSIESQISSFLELFIPVRLYEYQRFPYGMELDYESKFKCL